jgi:hypothetical protein
MRADKIGRVPVITLGIGGVALTTLFLGMSKSLMGIMIARFLGMPSSCFSLLVLIVVAAGLAAGNTAVIHSVLGKCPAMPNNRPMLTACNRRADGQHESSDRVSYLWAYLARRLCDRVNIKRTLASHVLMCFARPIIGGTFAHAATKFPSLFDVWLFREHPYLLPGMIAAAVAMTGSLLAFFQLEEVCTSSLSPTDIVATVCASRRCRVRQSEASSATRFPQNWRVTRARSRSSNCSAFRSFARCASLVHSWPTSRRHTTSCLSSSATRPSKPAVSLLR